MRSPEVKKQISLALDLKRRILQEIDSKIGVLKSANTVAKNLQNLRGEIGAVSEAFAATLKTVPYAKVNRRRSMLSGPFFISKDFAVPAGVSRDMYPLVQLELRGVSKAVGENLGDGLFQLWYDIKAQKELIRVIPGDVVLSQDLIDFNVMPLEDGDSFPIPFWIDLNPIQNGVKVVDGLVSCGVQFGYDVIDENQEIFTLNDDWNHANDWLRTLLLVFEKATPRLPTGDLVLGGTLFVIQYSYDDVKMRKLFNLADWGSSGSADIFFRVNESGVPEFSFWSCFR